MISYCQQRIIKLALASSSDLQQVATIMERLIVNFRSVFSVVVTGDDVQNKKPAPDIYLRVVEQLNLTPNECLAVEDSRARVESARAAGVICFAVRNRYKENEYLERADLAINSIQEALDNYFWGI